MDGVVRPSACPDATEVIIVSLHLFACACESTPTYGHDRKISPGTGSCILSDFRALWKHPWMADVMCFNACTGANEAIIVSPLLYVCICEPTPTSGLERTISLENFS